MTVWRITGKIFRTAIIDIYAQLQLAVLTILGLGRFCALCFIKVKLFVSLLCVCAILSAKAISEMTYTVSGGTLNPTYSLQATHIHIKTEQKV